MISLSPHTLFINSQITYIDVINSHIMLDFKTKSNLSLHNKDIKAITVEIVSNKK